MIPKYLSLTLPILKICKGGEKFHKRELADILADQFDLTSEERNRLKPSGRQTLLANRISWAVYCIHHAGLVSRDRGIVSITEDGKTVLAQNHEKIDIKFLMTIPKCRQFRGDKTKPGNDRQNDPVEDSEQSPEDMMISAYENIRKNTENELLEMIKQNSPKFFESLIVDLVRKMGYGVDSEISGSSYDGGIDGVIRQDKLGIGEIYLQAKRWKGSVPIKEVRDFAGALSAKKSKKGIFITSSDFTGDTYDFVKKADSKIILINGQKLVEYMYEYDVGVVIKDEYKIKTIDEDYFSGD